MVAQAYYLKVYLFLTFSVRYVKPAIDRKTCHTKLPHLKMYL